MDTTHSDVTEYINFNSAYYKFILDMLNTVYSDGSLKTQLIKILDTAGKFINVSRVYIFEDDLENEVSNNTYEWCAEGIEPQIDELQGVPLRDIEKWHSMLREKGIISADDIKTLPSEIYDILNTQGIYSVIVLPLYNDGVLFGYIGFDECRNYRKWKEQETETLRALSVLVATVIAKYNAEKKVNASQQIMKNVFDNIDTPIFATDIKTSRILFANRKFLEEYNCTDVIGELCWGVTRNTDIPCENCPREILKTMEPGAVYKWEVYNEKLGKWFYCTDRLITWSDNNIAHLQSALDITERKEYEEQLKINAMYDKMTGIYNRATGLTMFQQMLEEQKREKFLITFCYIDVDYLKHVNDNYGHIEGDKLIITTVNTIKNAIRNTDIFARLGGDEFMIAMRSCSYDNARKVLGVIGQKIDDINNNGELPYKLSFSVGIIEINPECVYDIDTIFIMADQRMYANKQGKKTGSRR